MQTRIEIPTVGSAFPFLQAKLLAWVKEWPDETLTVTTSQLEALCRIATAPQRVTPELVGGFYLSAPDFVLAVLTKARHEWRKLDKSKFGRAKKFVATNSTFKPLDNFPARPWCKIKGHSEAATDGDVAQAFEIATGEPVNAELVTKARKKVAAEVKRGIALHAKLTKPAAAKGGKKLRKASV